MLALLQSIGYAFFPVRDADDAADLLEAGARISPSVPDRSERMVSYLVSARRAIGARITPFQVTTLLDKLRQEGGGARFEAVAASIAPGEGQVIVTDRTACVVCGERLVLAAGHHGKALAAHPQLFTESGRVSEKDQKCTLLWKCCSDCGAKHYYSYDAIGGDRLPDGHSQVYPNWETAKYCHVSEHMVYETSLLLRYRQQCLHSHASALAFAREYDALARASGSVGLDNPRHWVKRLSHITDNRYNR